jgi:acyl-coenzyme A thioesterase PaaI-like protein
VPPAPDLASTGPIRRGAAPLPQALALAPLLREVAGLALALEAADPSVDALIGQLTTAARTLRDRIPGDLAPRLAAATGGRVYLDHARDIGDYNPCFPEYDIIVSGDRATGTVAFPLPFEGPPGIVHGGALSLFFDAVVQHHNCDLGIVGKTASLHVDYRRPAPLLRRLDFEVRRSTEGTRGTSHARLYGTSPRDGGERVYCTATVVALAGDVSRLPKISPRRTA